MIHQYTETKTCPRCGETKPSNEYATDRSSKDGLKFICNTCSTTYQPQRQRKSFDGITKQCVSCKRTLDARAFKYSQKTEDRLTNKCRTCKRYRGTAPLTATLCDIYETQISKIYKTQLEKLSRKYSEPPEKTAIKYRGELEEQIFKQMLQQGILHDWKQPEWIHDTSIT